MAWLLGAWLIAIICVLAIGCALVRRDYDNDQKGRTMTSTACDDQFIAEPPAPKLNPRYLPRSYPETLQDIIAIHARLEKLDSTDARVMVLLLGMASVVAQEQLDRIAGNAVQRMIGGSHV